MVKFGKRGQEANTVQMWFIVIGLILAGLVSCSSIQKTYSDLKGTTYEKNYFARELALALDAVYAAPGNVEYTYSLRDYKFVIEIKNSRIYVKESVNEKDGLAGIYDYFWNTDKSLTVRILPLPGEDNHKPMVIKFTKKNGVLSVEAENAALEQNVIFA